MTEPPAWRPQRVVCITTARSDYAPSIRMYRALAATFDEGFGLVVGGSHLDEAHGLTVREIESDGLPIFARVPFAGPGLAAETAAALAGLTTALTSIQPEVVVLYGDRFELLPAATAALSCGAILAHVCGGDVTEGAIDDSVRHAVTKLSHVHFPSTAEAAARLAQLGEEAWRIHHVGDPSIDAFVHDEPASDGELTAFLDGLVVDRSTLLVTFHPTTNELDDVPRQARAMRDALAAHPGSLLVTGPAPDPGQDAVEVEMRALVAEHPRARFVTNLGGRRYRAAMRRVGAVVGNSSSGIIEAGAVPVPAVDVGSRQGGRARGPHVVHAETEASAIRVALLRALDPDFRGALCAVDNPYGDGTAAPRIASVLSALPARAQLVRKRFVDQAARR